MRFRHSRRAAWKLLAGLALVAAASTVAATAALGVSGSTQATPQFTATDLSSAAPETISVAKSDSGRLAQTDPSLLGRSDSTPINVMIKYDYDPTASYTGGVDGLAPTSPRVTHKKLRDNRAAVQAYEAHTSDVSRQISSDMRQAVPGVDVRRSYQTVYGGVEARVPANKVADLLKIDGVVAVQKDSLNQALDDNTGFIGATRVWPSLGGSRRAGSNVVIGMIDSGVWPEHPMLSPSGIPASADGMRNCSDFATGGDVAHLGPPFSCNNKLIGAYAKTATYMAVLGSDGQEFCDNATGICSPRDSEGHGTHTTTTAAGDCVNSAKLYGVERGPVCGIAPGAHVIVYRVCLSQGCFSSDSVAAVQQAIVDGVDVINFSISGGAQPYTDPVELAFLDAVNAGISVNASAGNAGPGAGTSDHGGPWTTTVGASTGPRFFTTTLHLTADGGAKLDKTGVTVTNGISSPTPVVLAESIPGEDALCQTPLAAGAAAGVIVACQRGVNARVDKGFNVFSGGASGMILYNPVKQDVETDNHWLPAVHVDGPSTDLLDFINTHTNVKATFAQGKATATQPDVMAAFSSRGPTGDWIKPDVTAPGIQVLAGMTPQPDETTPTNGPPGNLYQAIAGTSMSSPHATGVSALVKAAHPDWTPEEIKSALMTSSVQKVVKEDGTTPADPFDMGAGSIRADRAVNPTLVFNETFDHFVASGTDPLHRIDLNIPSVDATTMTGKIVTHRTAINVSGRTQILDVRVTEPAGVDITVGFRNLDLIVPRGRSLTFPIQISAPDVANGQYFGRIDLVPRFGGTPVTIPVAFVRTQGTVTLTNVCDPLSFAVQTGVSHCTVTAGNLGTAQANASIRVSQREFGRALRYANVGAPGTLSGSGDAVQWSGTLSPAIAPQVTSIDDITGLGPAGGYLPLSLFGITAIPGVGDETITNFNVPTFYWGGEPYSRIGVVSDGYVVIGGGDASDVNFVPQTFPDTARPNNVLAPFWTDLNPSPPGGGAIRIGDLSDGSDTWLVVDFDTVANYSGNATHSGELWFREAGGAAGTGAASEQVTISYGAADAAAGDPGSSMNWGAENRDGTSGKNLASAPADDTEWRPVLTGPTTGGTVSIPFDVTSSRSGTFHSDASLTSNQTPGTTIVSQVLNVTR